jgi:hypothetical protein
VARRVWCQFSTNPLARLLRDSEDTHAKLRCNKRDVHTKGPIITLIECASKHVTVLELKKYIVMGAGGVRNQERLCWRDHQQLSGPGSAWVAVWASTAFISMFLKQPLTPRAVPQSMEVSRRFPTAAALV